jgi:MEDS: MEthanogen/methylotroph, DcmR Sensory domain
MWSGNIVSFLAGKASRGILLIACANASIRSVFSVGADMISSPGSRRDWVGAARLRFPELLCLHDPDYAQHLVRFYEDDSLVIDNVSYLAAQALAAGSSVVVLATYAHRNQIGQRLCDLVPDLKALAGIGRYLATDAVAALSQYIVNGSPDEVAFERVIGATMREAAKHSANDFVLAFGEMVALLCADNNPSAAIRLEQLWNGLSRRQRFSLYCAYPLSSLDMDQNADVVMRICAEHALTIPAESSL